GTFHLMQTLKNSPAELRRRFRRDRTESLSHGDPLFKVHYLGTEKIFSLDREQAEEAISHLLEGIANGKKLRKDHALVVRPRYVEVKELSTGRQLTKTYLQDIAYCAADTNRPNVFLYICKHRGQQLQCRVFWCSRAERARDMTTCLGLSFQRALSDWQQAGSATLASGEVKGKLAEESSTSPAKAKSSTLPAGLGKGENSLPFIKSTCLGAIFPQQSHNVLFSSNDNLELSRDEKAITKRKAFDVTHVQGKWVGWRGNGAQTHKLTNNIPHTNC
uniref:Si:dkey-19b23.8 n=1 Tax=Amphilophus citrinellus TaxID=61819 RepID=A0A3Q0SUI5_AMPCI